MKKIISLFIVCLVFTAIFAIPASAKNNTDQVFTFTFIQSDKADFTIGREKEDASGTYIKYTDGTAKSAKFQVYGGNYRNWAVCDKRYNETKYGYAFVYRGQEGCISQYVYENRYSHYNMAVPYAFLRGYVDIVDGGIFSTANGVWSPDTLGSYAYFNR